MFAVASGMKCVHCESSRLSDCLSLRNKCCTFSFPTLNRQPPLFVSPLCVPPAFNCPFLSYLSAPVLALVSSSSFTSFLSPFPSLLLLFVTVLFACSYFPPFIARLHLLPSHFYYLFNSNKSPLFLFFSLILTCSSLKYRNYFLFIDLVKFWFYIFKLKRVILIIYWCDSHQDWSFTLFPPFLWHSCLCYCFITFFYFYSPQTATLKFFFTFFSLCPLISWVFFHRFIKSADPLLVLKTFDLPV